MLSKKTQYAFQALLYLAQNQKSGPILIAEIAQKKKIPLKFLENILLEMRKDGILASKKGKGGGYFLAKSADKIILADVMRLIEGPISLLPCVSKFFYEKCANCDEKTCGLRKVLTDVRDANLAILEHQSVADIANL